MAILRFVEDAKTDVAERKRNVRAYIKEVRAGLDNKDAKAERLVKHTLAFLQERKHTGKNKVFVYLSFSTEADTDGLIETLLTCGYEVYCPKIEQGVMQAVRYGEDFSLSSFGIREPIGDTLVGAPDFSITPFLAVDKQGNRLGYGKGYYDAFFKRFPTCLRIGYGFACQVLKNVPFDESDVKLQYIVTEDGIKKINE